MTITKDIDGENNKGDGFTSDSESKVQTVKSPKSDSVVNVDFIGENLIRLDIMNISGDEGRYYSLYYSTTAENGTNGLFDLLDDFFSKKFSFFTSNKRTQSFLLALNRLEEKFYKSKLFDFKDYCETIMDTSIRKIASDKRFSNVLGIRISDGYSFGDEASELHSLKHSSIGIGNYMEKMGATLKDEFDSILIDIEKKKFCCVCVNTSEKLPPSFLIDPVVGLPLLAYSEDFLRIFLKNNFREFIESDLFKTAGLGEITIDMWAVSPDTTVKKLMDIIGEDGELKIEYSESEMDVTDMFLGKYKTLKFDGETYGKKNAQHNTVIGYM